MPMTMRAVGYRENLDVGNPASLVDVTMPVPRRGLCLREREPVSPLISCALRTTTMNAGRDRRLLLGKGAGLAHLWARPARC
jgi:hypothetical protein